MSSKSMNLIDSFEKAQIAKLTENKTIPNFRAGDTVKVMIRVKDAKTSRLQAFQGVVIAKKFKQHLTTNSSFTVRRLSADNQYIERCFMTYSPLIESIEVVKYGVVRRSKLYYLRSRTGKAARIKEKLVYKTDKKAKNK